MLTAFLALIVLPTIVALALAHKFASAVILYVIFSSIVDGMPAPGPDSSVTYRWIHASLNVLAGNIFRVLCALFPRFATLLGQDKQ